MVCRVQGDAPPRAGGKIAARQLAQWTDAEAAQWIPHADHDVIAEDALGPQTATNTAAYQRVVGNLTASLQTIMSRTGGYIQG